jgi:hypothetical protein
VDWEQVAWSVRVRGLGKGLGAGKVPDLLCETTAGHLNEPIKLIHGQIGNYIVVKQRIIPIEYD